MATKVVIHGNKRKGPPAEKSGPTGTLKKAKVMPSRNREERRPPPTKTNDDGEDEDDLMGSSDSEDGGVKLNLHDREPKDPSGNKSKDAYQKGDNSREAHAKQRQLAKERKAAKPLADEVQRAKKLWEKLRIKSRVVPEERKKLVAELFEILTGRMKEFVLKHDAVRAVQTAIKYASADQRKQIARELQGSYAQLAESRYAKFLIGKLMVYDDAEIRGIIIPEFYGRVRKLINHPEASWIVDDIYRTVATKEQKAILLREWYGPEFALLERSKDSAVDADLGKILNAEPSKRGPIMKYLVDLINLLIQKKMTGFTMLHDAMLQYYLNVKAGTSEQSEFMELVKGDEAGDLLKNMAFTKPGSRLVCLLLANGTSKDRRHILKAYKDTIVMLSGDQFGYLVLLTAFDVIDDTKMTSKAIFPELLGETLDKSTESVLAAASNPYARISLLYPIEGTSKSLFPHSFKDDLAVLAEVHEIRKSTSKKDNEVRSRELVAAMSAQLLSAVSTGASDLARDSFGCQLLAHILLSCEGDKTSALNTVAGLAAGNPNMEPEQDQGSLEGVVHISQTPHGGRLLKTLVAGGKFDKATGQIKRVEPPLQFEDLLYPVIKDHIMEWATGPSSLVIVALLEAVDFSEADALAKTLKKNKAQLQKAAKAEAAKTGDKAQPQSEGKGGKKKANSHEGPGGNKGSQILLEKIKE